MIQDLEYDPWEDIDDLLLLQQALANLAPYERSITLSWAMGYTNKELADRLNVSLKTFDQMLNNAFRKMRNE